MGNILGFNAHYRGINALYGDLRGTGEVEDIRPVDLITIIINNSSNNNVVEYDPHMRQMAVRGGGSVCLGISDVYESASLARVCLIRFLRVGGEFLSAFAAVMTSPAHTHTHTLAASDIEVEVAELKGQARAQQKARDDYGDRCSGPGMCGYIFVCMYRLCACVCVFEYIYF